MQYLLHGKADLANQLPLTAQTLFEIGSISKPLTALAALKQVQAGHWQLDRPLSAQFGLQQLAKHHYSLAQLITHQSGLPRLPANMPLDDLTNPYAGYSKEDLLAALASTDFEQQVFSYSNYGYGLLGFLLEQTQQQPFATIMQQQVFTPMGMKSAAVQTPGGRFKPLATGHAISQQVVSHWQFDSLAGAGAVLASIEDMAQLLRQLFASADSDPVLQQWLTVISSSGQPQMTPGWMQHNDWLWHNGQTAGFSSMLVFDPWQKQGLVLLSNLAMPMTEQSFSLFAQLLAQPPGYKLGTPLVDDNKKSETE